jgi:flagellar basal body rod protein FlgF
MKIAQQASPYDAVFKKCQQLRLRATGCRPDWIHIGSTNTSESAFIRFPDADTVTIAHHGCIDTVRPDDIKKIEAILSKLRKHR